MTVGVLCLFISVPWVGLECAIVVFPDHTHLLFVACKQKRHYPVCASAHKPDRRQNVKSYKVCVIFMLTHLESKHDWVVSADLMAI